MKKSYRFSLIALFAILLSAGCKKNDTIPSTTDTSTRVIDLTKNIAFGNVPIGQKLIKPFSIVNRGNSPLTVSAINLPTGYVSDFSAGNIKPGDSKLVNVTFTPTSTGAYSGSISLQSNATAGSNTVPVSGNGMVVTLPNPVLTPAITKYTSCSFSNQTGSGTCAGNTFLGGIVKAKVTGFTASTNTLTLSLEKCNGTFSSAGTAYLKLNNYCGTSVSQVTYAAGAASINLSVKPTATTGKFTYVAVLVNANSDKYFTMPVTVQY